MNFRHGQEMGQLIQWVTMQNTVKYKKNIKKK